MAPIAVAPARPEDAGFMAQAIDAARSWRIPFGTVTAWAGTVLATGPNPAAGHDDPLAHGEMVAIRLAIAARGARALRGAMLHTSGEPCPMGIGAILQCGFARLATRPDQVAIRCATIAAAGFAPLSIAGDVLSDEAIALVDTA